jgi:hypothetical protein
MALPFVPLPWHAQAEAWRAIFDALARVRNAQLVERLTLLLRTGLEDGTPLVPGAWHQAIAFFLENPFLDSPDTITLGPSGSVCVHFLYATVDQCFEFSGKGPYTVTRIDRRPARL